MFRKALATPKIITVILLLQFVPLVLFPPSSFSGNSQEWWLPVLLALMAMVGVFQIVFRKATMLWPWYLVGFAQGFNIISRLMMLMPHATFNSGGNQVFNTPYVILSTLGIILSAFLLWFVELPDVRIGMLRE